MEPFQTGLSNSAIEKINNMILQKKAAGQKVEPWEMEALMKAALSTEADRASGNYARNRELTLREQGQAADQAYRDEALKSSEKTGLVSSVGSLAITALGAKQLGLFGKTAAP
ncbi:MAG: hypothetical protein V1736_09725, partial [Pseudomonadota bacterium]